MSGSILKLEVEGIEAGSFQKDNMKEPRTYLRIWGKSLSNGKWAKSVCYGETAMALHDALKAGAAPGEDPAERRPIVEATGEWDVRVRETAKGPKDDRSFKLETFKVLSGPSVELAKTQRQSADTLRAADKIRTGGDIHEAYKVLEAFVARIARLPQPSLDMDIADLEEAAAAAPGPEEIGLAKLDQMERRRSGAPAAEPVVETKVPEAAVATVDVAEVAEVATPAAAVEERSIEEPAVETSVEAAASEPVAAQTSEADGDDVVLGEDGPALGEETVAEASATGQAEAPAADAEPSDAPASLAEAAPVAETPAEQPKVEDAVEAAPVAEVVETASPSQAAVEPETSVVEAPKAEATVEKTAVDKPAAAVAAAPARPALPVRPALPPRPGVARPALPPRPTQAAPAAQALKEAVTATATPAARPAPVASVPAAPAGARPMAHMMRRPPPRIGVAKPAPVAEVEAEQEMGGPTP